MVKSKYSNVKNGNHVHPKHLYSGAGLRVIGPVLHNSLVHKDECYDILLLLSTLCAQPI